MMDRDKSTLPDGPRNDKPNECKSWSRLVEKVYDEFEVPDFKLPDAPAKVKWKIGKLQSAEALLGNPEAFGADFLRVEAPFRAEIERSIRARCAGRSVPISAEVRYFMAVRGYVAIWFVRRLEIERELRGGKGEVSETIIPFPDARPWAGIIEWFMIDWWKQNGPWIAALLTLEEMHTGLEPKDS